MENMQPTTPIGTKEATDAPLTPTTAAAGKYAESMTSEPPSYTSRVSSPATQRRSRRSSRPSHRRSTGDNGQWINCYVSLLFSSQLMEGLATLFGIILAFDHQLTGMGMAMIVGLFVATVLKIVNACWGLAVDLDQHRTMFKWQCRLSFLIAGLIFFSDIFFLGVVQLISTGEFFANA